MLSKLPIVAVPASTPLAVSSSKGWKQLSVTDFAQDDMDWHRDHSQFRLRFTNDDNPPNPKDIYTFFCSGEHPTYKPELVIVYKE